MTTIRGKRGANAPALNSMISNLDNLASTNKLNAAGNLVSVEFRPSIAISATRLERLGIDIRSFREPLTRSVREVMVPSIRKNFDSGGRPAWSPLSDATLASRKAQGISGSEILVKSGALRKVATQINVWNVTSETASVRALPANVQYGYYHQAGAARSGRQTSGGGARLTVAQMRERAGNSKLRGKKKNSRAGGSSSGAIPARPFFVIQPEDHKDIQKVFLKWFEERARRQWG